MSETTAREKVIKEYYRTCKYCNKEFRVSKNDTSDVCKKSVCTTKQNQDKHKDANARKAEAIELAKMNLVGAIILSLEIFSWSRPAYASRQLKSMTLQLADGSKSKATFNNAAVHLENISFQEVA